MFDVLLGEEVIETVVYFGDFVHYFGCVFGALFYQKLGGLVTEEVHEEEVDQSGDGQGEDPDEAPVVEQVEEAGDDDGADWEPYLHKNWVFLSFLIADDLPEEEKGNINHDIRAESAHELTDSCHVDVEVAGDNDGTKGGGGPSDHERFPSA